MASKMKASKLKALGVLLIAPLGLRAEGSRKVNVAVEVPVVAKVESPSFVTVAPGETRLVTIRVACNEAWRIAVASDNAAVRATSCQIGAAGGMAATGHTFTIALACAPDAVGPQRAGLTTQLTNGARADLLLP